MTIPPNTSKGTYIMSVGIKSADQKWLDAVDNAGVVMHTGLILVGTLQVQ